MTDEGVLLLVFEEKTKKKKENWTEDRSARRTLTTITEGEEDGEQGEVGETR